MLEPIVLCSALYMDLLCLLRSMETAAVSGIGLASPTPLWLTIDLRTEMRLSMRLKHAVRESLHHRLWPPALGPPRRLILDMGSFIWLDRSLIETLNLIGADFWVGMDVQRKIHALVTMHGTKASGQHACDC